MEPRFETIDGLKVRYAVSPKAQAPTLLLLGPWPESILAYLRIWDALASKYSLVAADLPGFGKSEGRAELMSPLAMGDFVAKLVAHFGLARPHAVGPDVGTSALLFAAANHAGLFSSITIGGGASIFPLQVIGPLKDFIDAPSIDNFRGADVGAIIRSVVGAIPNYDAPTSVVQDYIDSYAGDRFPESVAFVRAYPKDLATLSSKLGSIDTPVQILSSGHDPYVLQSEPAELKSRLPKGRLVVLKSGHYAWEEDPVTFAGHISSWIDGGYLAP